MNGIGRGEDKKKQETSKASMITRETVGMTLLLFSAVLFFILVTGKYVFGDIGVAITSFFLGTFGYLAYPLFVLAIYYSLVLVSGKSIVSGRWMLRGIFLVIAVFFVVHLATTPKSFYANGYASYLDACWRAAGESVANSTGGGVVFGAIVYPVRAVISEVGAYIVFVALILLAVFVIIMGTPVRSRITRADRPSVDNTIQRRNVGRRPDMQTSMSAFSDMPAHSDPSPVVHRSDADFYMMQQRGNRMGQQPKAPVQEKKSESYPQSDHERSKEILFGKDAAASYRENLIYDRDSYFNTRTRQYAEPEKKPPVPEERSAVRPNESYAERWAAQAETPKPSMPRRVNNEETASDGGYSIADDVSYKQTPSYRAEPEKEEKTQERDYYGQDVPFREDYSSAPNVFDEPPARASEPLRTSEPPLRASEPLRTADPVPPRARKEERISDMDDNDRGIIHGLFSRRSQEGEEPVRSERIERTERTEEPSSGSDFSDQIRRIFDEPAPERRSRADLFDSDDDDVEDTPAVPPRTRRAPAERTARSSSEERIFASAESAKPAPEPQKHVYKRYVCPQPSLFESHDDTVFVSQEEIERNSAAIEDTLLGFRVEAKVVKVTCGATVTRYDLEIPGNVSVSTVVRRDEEIAMHLRARDGVNMYANRGNGTVSVEVPNVTRATVGIKSVITSPEFVNAKPGSLMFVIGKDVEGNNIIGNIVKMKHVLVAGSTGSGKSVCLNTMLVSLICKYSPEDLRLILIDPKKSEFTVYEGLPHLMINEIISDAQKAVMALNWAIKEMERRYELFQQKTRNGPLVKNIDEYNANLTEDEQKLPKIVVVVDELADLMSVAKKDIEERIQRLTQKARAAGIHLVIATQRPSVDVITGVIKGNLPTRIAFRVIQEVDSRTILDETGAQKLLGNGDMLYRTEGMFNCLRVQGAFLSSKEVHSVVENIKSNNEAYYDSEVSDYINNLAQNSGAGDADEEDSGEIAPQYLTALGIVVKLGTASISLIQRKCSVGYNHAGKILEWMEAMGYVSPFDGKAKARTVLLTKEEYESKYGSLD